MPSSVPTTATGRRRRGPAGRRPRRRSTSVMAWLTRCSSPTRRRPSDQAGPPAHEAPDRPSRSGGRRPTPACQSVEEQRRCAGSVPGRSTPWPAGEAVEGALVPDLCNAVHTWGSYGWNGESTVWIPRCGRRPPRRPGGCAGGPRRRLEGQLPVVAPPLHGGRVHVQQVGRLRAGEHELRDRNAPSPPLGRFRGGRERPPRCRLRSHMEYERLHGDVKGLRAANRSIDLG